jgi:hypothetical protein
MKLSSRCGIRCGGLIGLVVARHGPHDVEAAAGKCQHGLGVAFPLGAFAAVVDPRCGVGADGDVRRACHYRTVTNGQTLPDPNCAPGAISPKVAQDTLGHDDSQDRLHQVNPPPGFGP